MTLSPIHLLRNSRSVAVERRFLATRMILMMIFLLTSVVVEEKVGFYSRSGGSCPAVIVLADAACTWTYTCHNRPKADSLDAYDSFCRQESNRYLASPMTATENGRVKAEMTQDYCVLAGTSADQPRVWWTWKYGHPGVKDKKFYKQTGSGVGCKQVNGNTPYCNWASSQPHATDVQIWQTIYKPNSGWYDLTQATFGSQPLGCACCQQASGNDCYVCTTKDDCNGKALSVSGNKVDGCTCACQTGFSGTTCQTCASGYTGWPNCAQTACTNGNDCNSNAASVSGTRPSCTCTCKATHTGSTCSSCASGHESYPNCYKACTKSNDCNNRATAVSGNSNTGCTCTCSTSFGGSSCERCGTGYEGSYPTCYRTCTTATDCNNKATTVSGNVNAGCVCTCSSTFSGTSCQTCASGYETYPNCYRICTSAADCSNHASTVSGNSGSGCTCSCSTKYKGAICNQCSSAYESYPNCYRKCTKAADCNSHASSVAGNDNTGCTCTCSTGFATSTCNQCAAGYESYPNCYRTCTTGTDCSNNANSVTGNVNSGCTCSCSTGFAGSSCNTCASTHESYPNCYLKCTANANCNNHAASVTGNSNTGCSCTCSTGFTGATCNSCASGYESYPSCHRTCTLADCNNQATTVSGNTNTGCSCNCQTNFAGTSCQNCASGYDSYPSCYRTCTSSLDCSAKAASVTGNVNSGCICTCLTGFTGSSCSSCSSGYEQHPNCYRTCTDSSDCNSHSSAVSGNSNTGCSCTCETNFFGASCQSCASGYDSYPNCYRTCTGASDCSGNSASVTGNVNSGCICTCSSGFTGSSCNTCSPGYEQYPNCYRTCTDSSDCNSHSSAVSGNSNTGCSCTCETNFFGTSCQNCASGYDSYPNCYRTCTGASDCNGNARSVSGNINSGCSCTCADRFTGAVCDSCATGYVSYPNCYRICNIEDDCNGHAGTVAGNLDPGVGCTCTCSTGFSGADCGVCATGYEDFPNCYRICTLVADCSNHATSVSGNINSGCVCTCSTGFSGSSCNSCAVGYEQYPNCYRTCTNATDCSGHAVSVSGNINSGCTCECRSPLFSGSTCEACAAAYEAYPQCHRTCTTLADCSGHADSVSGHLGVGCSCSCSTGFAGEICDRCAHKFARYPLCQTDTVTASISETWMATKSADKDSTRSQPLPTNSERRGKTSTLENEHTDTLHRGVTTSLRKSATVQKTVSQSRLPVEFKTPPTVLLMQVELNAVILFSQEENDPAAGYDGRSLQVTIDGTDFDPVTLQRHVSPTERSFKVQSSSPGDDVTPCFSVRSFEYPVLDEYLSPQAELPSAPASSSFLEAVKQFQVRGNNFSASVNSTVDKNSVTIDLRFKPIFVGNLTDDTKQSWLDLPELSPATLTVYSECLRNRFTPPPLHFNFSRPTRPPAAPPTEQSQADKDAELGNTIAAVTGSGTVALQMARSTIIFGLVKCEPEWDVPLNRMQNPFQVSFSSRRYGQFIASAVLNNFVMYFCAFTHFMIGTAYAIVTKQPLKQGMRWARFPSISFIVPMFLIEPTAMSAVVTIIYADGVGLKVGGVVCLIFCLILMIGVPVYLVKSWGGEMIPGVRPDKMERQGVTAVNDDDDINAKEALWKLRLRQAAAWLLYFIDGGVRWKDQEGKAGYCRSNRIMFMDYTGKYYWFMSVELGLAGCIGILDGLKLGFGQCGWVIILLLILLLAFTIAICALRPYNAPFLLLFSIIVTIVQLIAAACMFINMYIHEDSWWVDVAERMAMWSIYLIIFRAIFDIAPKAKQFIMMILAWIWPKKKEKGNNNQDLSEALLEAMKEEGEDNLQAAVAVNENLPEGDAEVQDLLPEYEEQEEAIFYETEEPPLEEENEEAIEMEDLNDEAAFLQRGSSSVYARKARARQALSTKEQQAEAEHRAQQDELDALLSGLDDLGPPQSKGLETASPFQNEGAAAAQAKKRGVFAKLTGTTTDPPRAVTSSSAVLVLPTMPSVGQETDPLDATVDSSSNTLSPTTRQSSCCTTTTSGNFYLEGAAGNGTPASTRDDELDALLDGLELEEEEEKNKKKRGFTDGGQGSRFVDDQQRLAIGKSAMGILGKLGRTVNDAAVAHGSISASPQPASDSHSSKDIVAHPPSQQQGVVADESLDDLLDALENKTDEEGTERETESDIDEVVSTTTAESSQNDGLDGGEGFTYSSQVVPSSSSNGAHDLIDDDIPLPPVAKSSSAPSTEAPAEEEDMSAALAML